MTELKKITASEILKRYAKGERDFRYWQLAGADLRGADLSGADLSGADLSGAILQGADFHMANLSGVIGMDEDSNSYRV